MGASNPSCRVPRIRQREGRCYELACRGALEAGDWELVHGTVRHVSGEPMGHAWLEREGEVYDPVLDRTFPQVLYRQEYCASTDARFTQKEALGLLLEQGHYGPW